MIKLPPTLYEQVLAAQRAPAPARPRLKPLPYPHGAELAYAAALRMLVNRAAVGVRLELLQRLDKILGYAERRLPTADADIVQRADGLSDQVKYLVNALRKKFTVSDKEARGTATKMLGDVSAQHARAFASYGSELAINPLLGNEKWLPEAMSVATEQNVALIKSIPSTLFDDVERIVGSAALSGRRVEDVATDVQARFGVTERRAMLIARDQTAKWTGSLNRARQLDAGVARFEWMTVGDERVRPDHRRRDGKVYAWSNAEKIPGVSDVQCRCSPIPVLPEFEADSEE